MPANDPYIEAIAERVRGLVSRQLGDVELVAQALDISTVQFRRLIEDREHIIDSAFLLEVLGALVRVFALDPKWLLTGEYDAGTHRRAIELVEANPRVAERTLREWFREQYRRLRAGLEPWPLTSQ